MTKVTGVLDKLINNPPKLIIANKQFIYASSAVSITVNHSFCGSDLGEPYFFVFNLHLLPLEIVHNGNSLLSLVL